MAVAGIDVSRYQGNINYNQVKSAGKKFVLIQAGYGKYAKQKDPYFEQNYKNAKAAGLDVGVYWYSYAESIAEAKQEAEVCLDIIKGKQFEYPIYYDFEESSQFALGKNMCSEIIKTFCEALISKGYYPGLYIYRGALEYYVSQEVANKYAIAVAEYGNKCNYKGSYGVWQYSGSGYCSGINGQVDLDYAYVDYPNIIKKAGLNGFTKTPVNPAPKTTYITRYANDKSGVNYRKTPNGVLMGTYKYGDAISIVKGSEIVKDGLTWVKAKNGYWSAKNLLSTTKPKSDTYKTYYANDKTGVNYRKTPNGVLVGTYKYGEAVSILEGSEVNKGGYIWVKAKNGYYSVKTLLSSAKPAEYSYPYHSGGTYALQSDMKVRAGAGTGYAQKLTSMLTQTDKKNAYPQTYAVLKKGTKVTLLSVIRISTTEYWGKIASGYVCLMSGNNKYAK